MAIHSKTEEMLKEALEELYIAASLCIKFEKKNKGCLGYPAVILLLSIVSTMGSYYEGRKDFKIQIDGKQKTIDGGGFKHFYILNSEYFNFQLKEKSIQRIYNNYRSLLVHNAVIAKRHLIIIDDPLDRSFTEEDGFKDSKGNVYPCIYLKPFLRANKWALKKFIKEIDTIFSTSKQASIITKKV